MAEESSSVAATSYPPPNWSWWDLHPSTSSSQQDAVADSSHHHLHRLMGDAVSDDHIWRHVFSNVGNNGQMVNGQGIGESLLDALSCFNNVDHNKHFAGTGESLTETLSMQSNNMVANWPIAPPDRLDLCHAHQHSFNTSILGDHNKYHYGMHNSPRNYFGDAIHFSTRSGKPFVDNNMRSPKPSLKDPTLCDNVKKQAQQISSYTGMVRRRGHDVNEGKKKRTSEDNAETALKKSKQESALSTKVPKVKLAEKITALQQIVSPFGKTDTASVLYETIGYIKFLQEQVEQLTNPYKSHKVIEVKSMPLLSLRRRGLCLVPVSCTPQVYRENTGSEYWAPAYRGVFSFSDKKRKQLN